LKQTVYSQANGDTKRHCLRYSSSAYECMEDDRNRVRYYQDAISKSCKGARVLDIGTGPRALLACMALAAGAQHVCAVEIRSSDAISAVNFLKVAADEGIRSFTFVRCLSMSRIVLL
jgi:predicted RNA methylase